MKQATVWGCSECGTTGDQFSDEHCWDCYDALHNAPRGAKGKFSTSTCKHCGGHFATQFGNLRKHQLICASR